MLQKVTAFITREINQQQQLLLIQHPHAGIQIPAGTVEIDESVEAAVLREIKEETGLEGLHFHKLLGTREERYAPGHQFVTHHTKVFSRPDPGSFDWAVFRPGLVVRLERIHGDYAQVSFIEPDDLFEPAYVTYQITGWVPRTALAETQKRFFFWFKAPAGLKDQWTQQADYHSFRLFWAPLLDLPQIVSPQDDWLTYLLTAL